MFLVFPRRNRPPHKLARQWTRTRWTCSTILAFHGRKSAAATTTAKSTRNFHRRLPSRKKRRHRWIQRYMLWSTEWIRRPKIAGRAMAQPSTLDIHDLETESASESSLFHCYCCGQQGKQNGSQTEPQVSVEPRKLSLPPTVTPGRRVSRFSASAVDERSEPVPEEAKDSELQELLS